jgi:hypothetical protein
MKEKYKLEINAYDENWNDKNQLKQTAINFSKSDCMWLTSNDKWELEPKDLVSLSLPMVTNIENLSLQDKKIYRFPKLDLPRQKVDLLKEKYNCKVIRDPSKADVSVVSYKLFNTIFDREWNSSITYKQAFDILVYMKEKSILSDLAVVKLQNFLQMAPANSMVTFNIRKHWNQSDVAKSLILNDLDHWIATSGNTGLGNSDWVLKKENYKIFEDLRNNTSLMVYDSQICNIIDAELAVIENTEYDNIKNMITSADMENRSLTIEMLANCNIEKSFDVVSGLYYWHYDWFKNTTNWNSVNVKTMRNRLKAYEGNHCTSNIWSYNRYLSKLADDGKLSRFAVDKTRKYILEKLMGKMVGPESEVFKIDLENLYIADELNSKIND